MSLPRLIEVMADEGAHLCAAARAMGGRIAFDPADALRRETPMPLQPPGRWSANHHCQLVEAADGWIAVNLARDEDFAALPAWLGSAPDDAPWDVVRKRVRDRDCGALLEQAILLGLPVAVVGEQALCPSGNFQFNPTADVGTRRLTALDLSALWAGPYCGALLAEAGVAVTKVESPSRPDPTGNNPRLNGRKAKRRLDLPGPELRAMIAETNVLITSARPHALARLGLSEAQLFAANPDLIWIAITAYGWRGEGAMRVGFGDDCAVAGGLIAWEDGEPRFIGDALADPLTGLRAARLALDALANRRAGLIDVALAPVAAYFAARMRA
jgi:crotonobetainyl-CoA:carnitine CoA-transferase CaiB-like acyl-CoA transferase